ncbi:MAG: hypothetical protein JJU19_12360 [Pararhodobacter sp.]|nr:hypothetical protein [Pararhodobacter sp.]
MKVLATLVLLAGLLTAGGASAQSYQGGWSYTPQSQGRSERMWLGDGNDYGLHLSGTSRFCGQPGASYASMRQVLLGTRGYGNEYVTWWIANNCTDGYVRVCLRNPRGAQACSTYANRGWGYRP